MKRQKTSSQSGDRSTLPWPEEYRAFEPVIRDQWGVQGEIYLNRLLSGKSGAAVYSVDITAKDFAGQAILKFDRVSSADWSEEREFERHRRAFEVDPDYAQEHLPRVVHALHHGEDTAILSTIAARGLEYATPWADCAHKPQVNIARRLSADLLECWNPNYRLDPEMLEPVNLLESWLDYRLDSDEGGKIHEFLGEDCGLPPEEPTYIFEGQSYPNPLAFAKNVVPLKRETICIRGIRGNFHGDLHGYNILISKPSAAKPKYYLIDLDFYRDDGFLFFDHAYLELTYLIQGRAQATPDHWASILGNLSRQRAAAQRAGLTGDDMGLVQLVHTIRREVGGWIDRHEPNRLSYLESQYLLARIAAGLALVHQKRPHASRCMALTYAAANVADYLRLHRLDWPKHGPELSFRPPDSGMDTEGSRAGATAAGRPGSGSAAIATAEPLPLKPAVAVLPFEFLGAETDHEYIADGIGDELIAELSRIDWLMVIARTSSFAYKGRDLGVKKIGQELGVDYIVEGTVRETGRHLRVTAQLSGAHDSRQIWSDRYDLDLDVDDIFILQDEIARAVAYTIDNRIWDKESDRARRKAPENLDAWELYMRAAWHFYQFTDDGDAEATKFANDAVARWPQYAPPYALLAFLATRAVLRGKAEHPVKNMMRANEYALKAVGLDHDSSVAHNALSRVYMMEGRHDLAVTEAESAVALDPNSSSAYLSLAAVLLVGGRAAEALPTLNMSIRLSPKSPLQPVKLFIKTMCLFMLGKYEEAEEAARLAIKERNVLPVDYLGLALALVGQDRLAEAHAAIDKAREMRPEWSIAHLTASVESLDKEYVATVIEGLEKAGLPANSPSPGGPVQDEPAKRS
ncbi:MAG: hypothetical protein GY791_15930 [Alphaproteobacteria bacterium]|nr:hypothetical protein [Alphaproteobacteria bacterium]